MSGFKVNFSVNNQLATPSIHAAALANRPAAGQPGRVFIDTDNPSTGIYRDTGTAWVQIAETSDPEADTLQTVTDRGNTTTHDIAIGTSSTPSAPLDVHGADTIAILQGTGTNNAFLQFNKSGNGKFKTGNVHNGGNDYFTVYNMQENADAILVNISSNNVAIGGGVVAPTYRLDVQGSLRSTGDSYLATSGGSVAVSTATAQAGYKLTVNGGLYTTGGSAFFDNLNFSGAGYAFRADIYQSTNLVNRISTNLAGLISTGLSNNYDNFFQGVRFAEAKNTGLSLSTPGTVSAANPNYLYGLFGTPGVGAGYFSGIWALTPSYVYPLTVFRNTFNVGIGLSSLTDSGAKLQVNGTTSLVGDTTITTTTSARTLTISKGTSYNSINFQSSTAEFSFQNGSGCLIQVPGSTFKHNATGLFFSGFQNGSFVQFLESSTNNTIFYIKNGDTQQWNWAKNLKIDGGTSASQCEASSILEVSSTTKGFLPPRMTGAQAEAIVTPAAGLLVYANNGNGVTITTTGWWGYDGATWVKLN